MTTRNPDRQDDLPPPPPGEAVFTADVEDRIREDERQRVEDELRLLDGDERIDRHDARDRERTTRDRHAIGDDPHAVRGAEVRDDIVEEDVIRERRFSLGQALTLLVGLALGALGVSALVATGVDRPLNQPVEDVLGFGHTPWLGIGEVAAGVLLVLAAARPGGRVLGAIVGAGLVAVGVMIVAEMDWTAEQLGAERDFGWVAVGAGAVALLASLLTPRRYQHVTERRRDTVLDERDDRYVDDDDRYVDEERR